MASGRIITEGIPSASGAGGRLRAFKLLKCAHQGLTGNRRSSPPQGNPIAGKRLSTSMDSLYIGIARLPVC